jgi:hypothetical protein
MIKWQLDSFKGGRSRARTLADLNGCGKALWPDLSDNGETHESWAGCHELPAAIGRRLLASEGLSMVIEEFRDPRAKEPFQPFVIKAREGRANPATRR